MARILVADDEAAMRQMVRLACERAGHEVFEAGNAPTAVEAYERLKPDLLVLDLHMPGGGWGFAPARRGVGRVSKLPVTRLRGLPARLGSGGEWARRWVPDPLRSPFAEHASPQTSPRGRSREDFETRPKLGRPCAYDRRS